MTFVTLLSDFGLQDATAAIAKGILMQQTTDITIVDITHEIQPFNKRQAAYFLWSAYKNFLPGTIHIALIDIFYAVNPIIVVCKYNGQYFIGPDNGLIPLSLEEPGMVALQYFEIGSNSFHSCIRKAGEYINQIQNNTMQATVMPAHSLAAITGNPLPAEGLINCEVVHIDAFGNVVTSFTRRQYKKQESGRQFTISFILFEAIKEISNNYNDVKEGYKLCRFNSNDYLEICVNRGNAASLFGLKPGSRHNNIQISFT